MKKIHVDFNDQYYPGRVSLWAESDIKRLSDLGLQAKDRVFVFDGEGLSCEGTLVWDETMPEGFRWFVDCDWETLKEESATVSDISHEPMLHLPKVPSVRLPKQ
ncbi:hypothetical protein FJZ31_04530 [Candidatus Poribacteria bacterium]|nr:hypothetical protein [Candidatus Poribacteria bacterium]